MADTKKNKPLSQDTTVSTDASVSNPGVFRVIRNRVIAGLFVVLPLFVTYGVMRWLYDTLVHFVLNPVAYFLRYAWNLDEEKKSWMIDGLLSLSAFGLVIGVLFVAGMFFQTRIHRSVDWVLMNVPGVNTVYSTVSNVFKAISGTANKDQFKRVVLVEFPHPGIKAPAFVTGECTDELTGKTILSVYVPTTPVPTSGYMLLIPQENVIDLNWDLEETLQAIVSGGISLPKTVTYEEEPPVQIST